jgi:hypothetical protein
MNLKFNTLTAIMTAPAPTESGFIMTFISNFTGSRVAETFTTEFTASVMIADGASDEQMNVYYEKLKSLNFIKVRKIGLVSMLDLEGKTFFVIDRKTVNFASGDQTYFIIKDESGEQREVAERFTEGTIG